MRLSLVTPAFNEAENLPALYDRVAAAAHALGLEWEWVIVDDHSRDRTFEVVRDLALRDPRIRGVRLARNSGSHTAIACGLHHATGDAAVVLASDLQDPPETLAALLNEWRAGAQVVWAVRRPRRNPGTSEPRNLGSRGFARLYYFLMRHVVGMKEMPATGADFFLVDRAVIEAFRRFPERHVSVLALITWMGYRQAFVEYDKEARRQGRSGWTLAKKVTLVVDSVTAFSEFPIRLCSYAGGVLMTMGIVGAIVAVWTGHIGMSILAALVVALSGLQLLALGVVGEYVWRALDEARRRPLYLVEAVVGASEPVASLRE